LTISTAWRGDVASSELNALHAEAFEHPIYSDEDWNWTAQLEGHSLGWVTAREEGDLVGFVNVVWDGVVHAFVLDTMVASRARRRGVGKELVAVAEAEARRAGCEWLHVDFDDELREFYLEACGFRETNAGLIALRD
jgi:GNAT superfamily N-acetyltransferase